MACISFSTMFVKKEIYIPTIRSPIPICNGKPTMKTAFYSASADGTLTYPINHWIHWHRPKDQLRKLCVAHYC